MKIAKIEINDFRGFPGPSTYTFDLGNARHMLLYGENGSGKSSVFHALQEFFNLDHTAKPFATFKNIFSDPALASGNVAIHFDDGAASAWPFGGARPVAEPRVSNTAIRVGCLDYRSLLRTNFDHKTDQVNLFDVAVGHLLTHHPVVVGGRQTTIGALWQHVLNVRPQYNGRRRLEAVAEALANFNNSVQGILPALTAKTEQILQAFPGCGIKLTFEFPGVEYLNHQHAYGKLHLHVDVTFNETPIRGHQHFLNEARLSAIGIALYLAGLLISIPPPPPGAPGYPSVLVLDDVLIGLDMNNRLPLLAVLQQHFAAWQVFLLTHDPVWNDMVVRQMDGNPDWCFHELFLKEVQGGIAVPIHKPPSAGGPYYLNQARERLADGDDRGAAQYARMAFESKIKKYCEEQGLRVRYNRNPNRMDAQSFWNAIKQAARDDDSFDAKQPTFNRLEMFRSVALNPLSHEGPAAITRDEIRGAIDAVEALGAVLV